MKKAFLLIILSILFIGACRQKTEMPQASADAKRYALKGTIVSVDKAKKKAEIDHEEIPGFMPKMTMNFPIHAESQSTRAAG
jgi:protein SCO1